MKWLALEILSALVGMGTEYFCGFFGKYREQRILRRLKKQINNRILGKYGNAVYFNNLDAFLSRNHLITRIIENCKNASTSQYKSQRAFIDFNIKKFEEEYPNHFIYRADVITIIKLCFDIIADTLAQVDDQTIRTLSMISKDLASDLEHKLDSMHDDIKQIKGKLDLLTSKTEVEPASFDFSRYLEHLLLHYPSYPATRYIERSIFPKSNATQQESAFDTLLKQKKVLLLGEAGFGKTYEAITLLRNICKNNEHASLIPVYLPLVEFGHLYTDIKAGIVSKIELFCKGDTQRIVEDLFVHGRLVLILDGIDDISDKTLRSKFIAEIKDIVQRFSSCLYFATARANRYHNELNDFLIHEISNLDELTIRSRLQKEGIYIEIPKSYFHLFRNPLFFEAGIVVLKNEPVQKCFNRSTLFEKLISLLYIEWDQKKGIYPDQSLCCSDFISLIGEFSFNSFNQPSYSYFEFEARISELVKGIDNSRVLNAMIASDIFRISDKITFSHKLFKEFCTAYYLKTKYPYISNKELYSSLIKKEEWKEVFIFIAGLFTNIDEQDRFLDFVMEENLRLYIDCIDAKSDLFYLISSQDHFSVANRYLSQIFKTYTYILYHYFEPISFLFDPQPGKKSPPDQKIGIMGSLSSDGAHLDYWFERLPVDAPDISLIPQSDLSTLNKQRTLTAVKERRNTRTHYINLNLSGLEGDTGRKIGINHIKEELVSILKKRMLFESKYLLCEYVSVIKKRIKPIKESLSLTEMQEFVDAEVSRVLQKTPSIEGFQYNGIDMFSFQAVLAYLNRINADYCECILPSSDQKPEGTGSCWVWDMYSNEQKIKFITTFFQFYQLSYIEMVERNFPKLKEAFSEYLDFPYKLIVYVNLEKDKEPYQRSSDPVIHYYHIASDLKGFVLPEIHIVDKDPDHEEVFSSIAESYQMIGKTANKMVLHGMLFSGMLSSVSSNSHGSLSDQVYNSIQSSLSEVFHDLR